ncbi:alpha/beta fold hydrolase [Cryobacterium adonitolivorans]|uniref:alpha/beta fold hydrolase n=1 Tax=Cryobacterium adonitolivorans TaxID=1259189 RepID=UPI0018E09FEB|nr:hypothetical protein [Cryobacterium adonitolivorans]
MTPGETEEEKEPNLRRRGWISMPSRGMIADAGGTEIYYTERGTGQAVLLSHGWPLSSDVWQVELRLHVPTFIAHGDDDQIVPIGAASLKTAVYGDYRAALDKDILAFLAE